MATTDHMNVREILDAYKSESIDLEIAESKIRKSLYSDLGHTLLDLDREARTGSGEVIFGAGKTAAQLDDIIANVSSRGANILITRLDRDKYSQLSQLPEESTYHEQAQLLAANPNRSVALETKVAVVTAGTSDIAIAEEAALTAEFYGSPVDRVFDVGVAGLHRLVARMDTLKEARVIVVVAGMEGALPSVVGGLVSSPVIAVPTSVGYGAALEGMAALLGMLTSCASGVSVVNIDNGFGAGFLAHRINSL
tara:strand:- start:113 stop:868 length:756 start_codon:yes stop_codon:yes gene_type:complete